jgi:uncharacterized membrane-anchored protein YhcB (DUF1043 family)
LPGFPAHIPVSCQSSIHYNQQQQSVQACISGNRRRWGQAANCEDMQRKPAVIPLDDTTSIWATGILSFALGLVLGCIGTYLFLGRYSQTAHLREELSELRERFSDYRDQVTRHFMHTSELVQEMTRSYRAVYEHLATGAQELCEGEVETPSLDTPKKDLLVENAHPDDDGYGDELLGDTPRISDLKIKVEPEKNRTQQH